MAPADQDSYINALKGGLDTSCGPVIRFKLLLVAGATHVDRCNRARFLDAAAGVAISKFHK